MKKPTRATPESNPKRKRRDPNQYSLAIFTAFAAAIAAAVVGSAVALFSSVGGNSQQNVNSEVVERHRYAFSFQGREVSGESFSTYEETPSYLARVEVCERYGIEDIYVIVSCYLTVRPLQNITISNSDNETTAIYNDGSVATICCMYIENSPPVPLYRIGLPRGAVTRRTFRRGSEIHLLVDIPGADPRKNLDAISFSPGEGATPVLFPIGDNLRNRVFSTEFVNAHRDDPRVQQLIRDGIQAREELKARERENAGLTYPQ